VHGRVFASVLFHVTGDGNSAAAAVGKVEAKPAFW
jgi:hypothetical protein